MHRVLLAGDPAGLTLPEAEVRHVPAAQLATLTRESLADRDLGVVAGGQTLAVLRRLHQLDPALQLAALVPRPEREAFQRALLFTPGLGEVWLVENGDVDPGLLERAGAVTRARRGYRAMRDRAASDLALIEPHPTRRAVISDAFLAALLQATPDPIAALDPDGRILTWNAAAERLFGVPRARALGSSFAGLIELEDDGPGEDRAGGVPTRLVRFRRGDGQQGYGELIRMPIEWGERTLVALALHDQTVLRRSQAELENQAAELEEQAAELETVNEELERQRAELREALQARSRFYAAMSHELRTPINAIMGYNALLLEGIFGTLGDAQQDKLQRAQRAAHHLLELVNDVLDLARIEAGRVDLEPEEVSFPVLLSDLLETVHSLAEEYRAPLSLHGPDVPHAICSDPRRVRQILLNLISNAVKYGHDAPIRVEWCATPDGGVEIDIADQGPGIEPADQQRIFREFEQVRNGDMPERGTGLGLAISSELAALLGGAIRLASQPGQGSTFTLVLPAAPPDRRESLEERRGERS
jgi:PAS domain S-box-containing protein